jgi:hypothetical protein
MQHDRVMGDWRGVWAMAFAAALVGCPGERDPRDGAVRLDGGGLDGGGLDGGGLDGGGLDGGASDAGGADGGMTALPRCTEACTAPADCASAAPTVDADNWACDAGSCRYLGCRSDAECQDSLGAGGGTWRCADGPGGLRQCAEACTAPSDCATGAPVTSADNYACEAGLCRYLGCLGDAECQDTFGGTGGSYRCAPLAGGVPSCLEACTRAADCAGMAASVDEDNYACEEGVCTYLGCRSDAECAADFGPLGGTWRCR